MTQTTGGYTFGLLGSLEVAGGGRPVEIPGRRPRALLAILLLQPNRTVPVRRIIHGLWGAQPPKTARESVQFFVHQLRRALPDPEWGRHGIVETHGSSYLVRVDPLRIDLVAFQELAEQAGAARAAGDPETAWSRYEQALALWRGPALADFTAEPFAQVAIERLQQQRLAALEAQMGVGLELGRHGHLAGELEALVRSYPQREELLRLLMVALYRAGRQAEALAAYQTARDQRRSRTGSEPGARLQALQRAILDHDPSLDLPSPTGAPATHGLPTGEMAGVLGQPPAPQPRHAATRPIPPRPARLPDPDPTASEPKATAPAGWDASAMETARVTTTADAAATDAAAGDTTATETAHATTTGTKAMAPAVGDASATETARATTTADAAATDPTATEPGSADASATDPTRVATTADAAATDAAAGDATTGDTTAGADAGAAAVAAPREERRLVTVLAVGSAASVEPTGEDPEDVRSQTAAAMAHLSERIGHYGGVVHAEAMGRLLGVFGAGRSHDDDPERAVRAALELLDGLEPPLPGAGRVCAGVATGEVVVTYTDPPAPGRSPPGQPSGQPSGQPAPAPAPAPALAPAPAPAAADGASGRGRNGAAPSGPGGSVTVAGDVLTAAVGLQAVAQPGTVAVGAGTYRATRRVIEYRPLAHTSDQQTTWLTAWQALAPRGRTGAEIDARRASPLTERERELGLLNDLLGRFLRERTPQLLTIIAEPGLGKSRLVAELARLVDQEAELVGWRLGRSRPHAEGTFAALAEIVKSHADILDTDTADTALGKLQETITDTVGDPAESAWVTRQLRALLAPGPAEPAPGDRQQEILGGWVRFFQAAASSRPLVVVFEDLQWADRALVEFVEDLAEQVEAVPLLVVATARPELLELRRGWGGGKRNAATLSLSPLSRDGTGRLLDALLGEDRLPAGTRGTLLDSSGGNPLYVEEYVRMLHDLGPDAVAAAGELPIPESVQQLIAARLDTLPLDDRLLLQDAAVIGQTFWDGALAAVGGYDRDTTRQALAGLERREFLRRARVATLAGETEYVFRHALVRDVAYHQILRGERAAKHRRVAAWIQGEGGDPGERAEVLAYHYTQALELTRAAGQPTAELAEQTRGVLRVAGDRVGSLGAMTAAARFYEQALALWPPEDPERATLLLRLGEALAYGQHTGADVLLQAHEVFEAAGKLQQAAEVDVILAQLARIHGDHATAAGHLERALALGPARSPELLVAMSAHAVELLLTDAYPKAVELGEQATRLGAEQGLVSVEGLGRHAVGAARLFLGDPDGAAEIQDSIELLVEAGHATVDFARFGLPSSLWWFGDLEGCARTLAEQHAAVRDTELVMSWFDIIQAALDYTAGRWDAAGELIDRYLSSRGSEPGNHEPWCLALRGWIRLGRGNLIGALSDADAAATMAARTHSRRYRQVAQALRGRVLHATGRADRAAACVRELLAEQRAHPRESTATPDLAALVVDLDLPAGDLSGELPPTAWHQGCRALADRDLTRAADAFAAVGSLIDHAAVRLRLAQQHTDSGEVAAASGHLDAAVRIYQTAGAHAPLRQADALAARLDRLR